jgi:hypothetical protein
MGSSADEPPSSLWKMGNGDETVSVMAVQMVIGD